MSYSALPADAPSHPPAYDLESAHDSGRSGPGTYEEQYARSVGETPPIEQFDIEDDDYEAAQPPRGLLGRAKHLASSFKTLVIRPVVRIVDPMYEGYSHLNAWYERLILKIGNPLVVKRLLYVFFVMIFIFAITKFDTSAGVSGASGGAFSSGKFYDMPLLSRSLHHHIDENSLKENLEYLLSMPHVAGTKGDLTLARYIESFMNNKGVSGHSFDELQAFANYPKTADGSSVKLSDGSYTANLAETGSQDMEFWAYNPNSLNTNHELEAPYVYANYGTQDDFQKLKDSRVDMHGAIVLVRYGGLLPEPNKVHLAQQYGAVGVVFVTLLLVANGKEHDDAIQRLNVGFTRVGAGDVLTPGWSVDAFASRFLWAKSPTTPKIPSLPVSWRDGKHFIENLGSEGVQFDDGFHSGSGKGSMLKLTVKNDERNVHLIWNVVGTIEGREQAEKAIIIGAARDAPCFGTISAGSGSAILLELVRTMTSLQRQYNWSPTRSIYFLSFDATEYSLAGATEWIETKKQALQEDGYVYIDLSDAVSGNDLSVKAHPLLQDLIKDAMRQVSVTQENGGKKRDDTQTLYDLFKSQNGGKDDISYTMIEQKNYLPFINTLNMPAVEIKFTGTPYPEGSCYDNFDNFEASGIDSNMAKHKQLVELLAIIALNLAEAPIIPYNFEVLAYRLTQYQRDLEQFSKDILARDSPSVTPVLHFDGLGRAIDILRTTGKKISEWSLSWKEFVKNSADVEPSMLAMSRWKWNNNMVQFNSMFLSQEIIPLRPGYSSMMFGVPLNAPPKDDGKYEWNSFPRVRDSLLKGDYRRAQEEINAVATMIADAAARLTEFQ